MFQYDLINLVLVSASDGGHDSFDWIYVLKHSLNLAILVGILIYLTKDSLRGFLQKRKEKLTFEIDQAKNAIEEAKLKHEEYKQKLANLASEIDSLKDSIKKQGEIEKEDIIKQANTSSELMKKELKETIHLETVKAKDEIQKEVVDSSVLMAEKLIKENIDDNYTTNSVDDFINMIEEGKWQQLQH
ncbi:MAG: hypothetical protein GTO02_04020 [Candidatus Dadabacteria bacterium]|nr:hypothetical protein [Candidatus Dadabacteria bacterium]NIQ13592.1 hypothetical protein [Candidatus Dadabacteria bacterium]